MSKEQIHLVPIGDLEWFSFPKKSDKQEKVEGNIWKCLLWIMEQNGTHKAACEKYKQHINAIEEEVLLDFLSDYEQEHITIFTPEGQRIESTAESIQERSDFPELLILNTTFSRLFDELYEARKSVAKSLDHTFLIFHVLEIDFAAHMKGQSTLLNYSEEKSYISDPQIGDVRCLYSSELMQMLLKNGGSGLLNNLFNNQLVKISTDTPNEENNERIIAMLCNLLADVFPKQLRFKDGKGSIKVDAINQLLLANFDLHDATEYPKERTIAQRIPRALETFPNSRVNNVIAWKFKRSSKAKVRVKSVEVEIETSEFETVVERWGMNDPISVFQDKKRELPETKKVPSPYSKK